MDTQELGSDSLLAIVADMARVFEGVLEERERNRAEDDRLEAMSPGSDEDSVTIW